MQPTQIDADQLYGIAPALRTGRPLIVFDDACVLCSVFVQWVMKRDRRAQFLFTSARGPVGQWLYQALDLDPVAFETHLLVCGGVGFGKLDAFMEAARRLGGPYRAFLALRLLPRAMRDGLYDRVARNRYALFGKRRACWLPRAELMERVI